MGNELIPQIQGQLSLNDFNSLVTTESYLGRLQLYSFKSDACAEGKIPSNHWGLINDEKITDLGAEVDVLLVSWRPKALQIDGDNVVVNHDPASETFQKIAGNAGVMDSGCMYGPEFLVWLPSVKLFATYFANSKTARREAKKCEPLMRKAATFKSKLITGGKYKWQGPVVVPCTTPIELPETAQLEKQVNSFLNPPKPSVETTEPDARPQ